MKKRIMIAALVASALLLTACGNTSETGSIAETSLSDTTAEVSETTETAEETTTESDAETTEDTTAEATAETNAEATAETKETVAEAKETPDANFASIAGDWYIDGDTTLASLHIEPDGSFKTYYADGVLESEGTIRYEAEEIEGTTNYWYHLYATDGTYIMGFADDGSSTKTDLYVGNGGEPHYQKFGAGGAADDGRAAGEAFVGTWGCGRATLKITQLSDTSFHALLTWSSSAATHAEWDYPLTYQDGKLVCDGAGTLTYVEYASADAEPDKTVEYTDGSAEFVMQGAGIVWNDLTEHSGDDMVFLNSQPE